jgi:hypothetical protein
MPGESTCTSYNSLARTTLMGGCSWLQIHPRYGSDFSPIGNLRHAALDAEARTLRQENRRSSARSSAGCAERPATTSAALNHPAPSRSQAAVQQPPRPARLCPTAAGRLGGDRGALPGPAESRRNAVAFSVALRLLCVRPICLTECTVNLPKWYEMIFFSVAGRNGWEG